MAHEQGDVRSMQPGLRVALVAEAAGGGVAVHLVDLIRELAARGVEVHLVVPLGDRLDDRILTDAAIRCCASVTRVPMYRSVSWRDMLSFVSVFRALWKIQPHVVHAHSSKAGVLARLCFGRWKKVYTPHAVYTLNPWLAPGAKRFYGSIERWFGNWLSDRIIAVSDDEARHLQTGLRIDASRITTIYNGVPGFSRLARETAREALGLRADAFVVGLVGRFEFQKGIDRFVDIARRVATRCGDAVQFALAGQGDIEAATGMPVDALPSNIHVIGALPDARRFFCAFDVFALPSRYEGFPYVYLEAIATGVPIVTTRVAGADAFVSTSGVGLVVDNSDDMTEFADAITTIYESSPLRDRMVANCAATARRFTAEGMVARTLAVYRQAMTGSRE
ncbi:glycosyltransferase family 4 protein [Paraburkholderia sartisoli]|nr:glycosyltransferase family 4 protein [Paraburkholderia sartisoli]